MFLHGELRSPQINNEPSTAHAYPARGSAEVSVGSTIELVQHRPRHTAKLAQILLSLTMDLSLMMNRRITWVFFVLLLARYASAMDASDDRLASTDLR